MKKFFTKDEAEARVGRNVIAKKPFLSVPFGAIGQVNSALLTVSGYCVIISWQDGDSEMAISKDEYDELITEKTAAR